MIGGLVLVVALVGCVAMALRIVARDAEGPGHPRKWDSRVQPYADVVERERGLEFKHPVYVDFLSDKAFNKQVVADKEDLTDEDRVEIEQATGQFRALGLVQGDVDVFDSVNELSSSAVIGFYSFDDERIRVRGTELTPEVQSTLVHELTHALQDQYFDVGTRFDLVKDDDTAAAAYRTLVEGDARRVETAWRESLDKKSRKALEAALAEQGAQVAEDAKDVPEVLKTLMAAPYEFGEAMLRVAVAERGDTAVDGLFRVPPTTEEHQLDPWTLVQDRQAPLPVRKPRLMPGDESIDDGPFGAIGWLIVLGERLPAKQALAAADGWGGDSYVAFERDGTTCVRINYRGDTPQDLREMDAALNAWVAESPAGSSNVERKAQATLVKFESCDPGTTAPQKAAVGGAADAVQLALGRTYLSATLLKSGLSPDVARCGAERLVLAFTTAELNDPALDRARVQRVIAPCREA